MTSIFIFEAGISLVLIINHTGPGFPFGEEGGAGDGPRAPPPGYPGTGQMTRMRGPMPGNGDRWPQQQMVRPPHPGQIRPGKLKLCTTFT